MREKEITLLTFGFKYGLPAQSDMVLDMRGLRNPYYIPELSILSGCDKAVRDYIFGFPESTQYLNALWEMLRIRLQLWQTGKLPPLCVAVGCTGGRHRSVTMALALAQRLRADGWCVRVIHRDIEKGER